LLTLYVFPFGTGCLENFATIDYFFNYANSIFWTILEKHRVINSKSIPIYSSNFPSNFIQASFNLHPTLLQISIKYLLNLKQKLKQNLKRNLKRNLIIPLGIIQRQEKGNYIWDNSLRNLVLGLEITVKEKHPSREQWETNEKQTRNNEKQWETNEKQTRYKPQAYSEKRIKKQTQNA